MLKKINYTGRKKIDKSEVTFSLVEDGPCKSFNVVFKLKVEDLPADASLYVEAYYKETRQRFYFGTISNQKPPSNTVLDEIDMSAEPLFRVLIIDESGKHGLILASGGQFRTGETNNSNAKSLMAVELKDLGSEVWKVEFDEEGTPELCINMKIPNAINRLTEDKLFQSLIMPAAFKEILMYFLWDGNENETEITEQWMKFAEKYGGKRPDFAEDLDDIMKWVDEVISAFATEFQFCELLSVLLEDS